MQTPESNKEWWMEEKYKTGNFQNCHECGYNGIYHNIPAILAEHRTRIINEIVLRSNKCDIEHPYETALTRVQCIISALSEMKEKPRV